MVVISAPSFITASVRQDTTRRPSTSTVQAALAMVAALLGSGEIEIFTQRVAQRGPGPKRQRPLDTIDSEGNGLFGRQLRRWLLLGLLG